MRDQITIFLPVETKSRELPYKSPLAFLLANLGCKVLIGRQQELRLLWFNKRNFFYLDKKISSMLTARILNMIYLNLEKSQLY